jgi:Tol biopolymer transport system component
MPRMNRLLAGVGAVACTISLLFAGAAAAAAPPGPRLTFMRTTGEVFELVSSDPAGQDQQVLAGGDEQVRPVPDPFTQPAWSGDGMLLAFSGLSRLPGGHLDIYRMNADGSDLRRIPGTRDGIKPVLSPDGRTLAFARLKQRDRRLPSGEFETVFDGASTWVLNLDGGAPRRITPWEDGLRAYPSSFTPDGRALGISQSERLSKLRARRSALVLPLNGGKGKVIAENAGDPVFSPDGSKVALVLEGRAKIYRGKGGLVSITPRDLAIAAADGSGLVRLTNTKALELLPRWDPSGQRLVYIEQRASRREADLIGFGDSIMQINADGSCRTRTLSEKGAVLYGAIWQPGVGREAGPIAC